MNRQSLTDEEINQLTIESQHRSVTMNHIDASRGPTIPSSVVATTMSYQSPKSITATVPQMSTTINVPQNLLDGSKVYPFLLFILTVSFMFQATIQAEYQQKGEDDDYIPLEAKPARRDYGKKALVYFIDISIEIIDYFPRHWLHEIIIN